MSRRVRRPDTRPPSAARARCSDARAAALEATPSPESLSGHGPAPSGGGLPAAALPEATAIVRRCQWCGRPADAWTEALEPACEDCIIPF